MKRLVLVMSAIAAGACGSGKLEPPPQASSVTFQLRNDGQSTVYLFENCTVDYTITSLAEPVHEVARVGACACECGQACPVCGPCFAGPREVAVGAALSEYWSTVSVTTQPTAIGGTCEQRTPLPYGRYRIDVPVYPTTVDATGRTLARTATQTFDLPVAGDTVDVQLGLSP
jgi:hypothetical protein